MMVLTCQRNVWEAESFRRMIARCVTEERAAGHIPENPPPGMPKPHDMAVAQLLTCCVPAGNA